jgi:NADH dehydrogenase
MAIRARIYRPEKATTQSGKRKTKAWVLEYDPERKRQRDKLTGWTGSDDMRSQVRMEFPDKESAVAYVERKGIDYEIKTPSVLKRKLKSYTDNFKASRRGLWTH